MAAPPALSTVRKGSTEGWVLTTAAVCGTIREGNTGGYHGVRPRRGMLKQRKVGGHWRTSAPTAGRAVTARRHLWDGRGLRPTGRSSLGSNDHAITLPTLARRPSGVLGGSLGVSTLIFRGGGFRADPLVWRSEVHEDRPDAAGPTRSRPRQRLRYGLGSGSAFGRGWLVQAAATPPSRRPAERSCPNGVARSASAPRPPRSGRLRSRRR
jgi:hypothetical protein